MNEVTKALIDSLNAVSIRAAPVANAIMVNQMPPADQRRYADLLNEVSNLLRDHADTQEAEAANG